MNLNQIFYFNELAKQHQFSKAARKLNISQPSLSNSIKSLEKELNCHLIQRQNGRIELTKYGQIFFQATNSVISILKKTKHNIDQTKRSEANTIEIGCIPPAAQNFLPYIISELKKQTDFSFNYIYHRATSDQICHQISEKEYDLGICAKVDKYPDLKFIPLYEENTRFTNKTLNSTIELTENTRTIYLVYNLNSVLAPATRALIDFLTES